MLTENNTLARHEMNAKLQAEYSVSKRTVNSAIADMQGRLNALRALKETETQQYEAKIKGLEKEIEKLSGKLAELKPDVAANDATEAMMEEYRRTKARIYYKRQRLNKYRMRLKQLEKNIKKRIHKICFGGKKLFDSQYRLDENGYTSHEKWYTTFRRRRDANIFYVGSHEETQGNQMFQVTYDEENDSFTARVRTEHMEQKYVEGAFQFNYKAHGMFDVKNHITSMLKYHETTRPKARGSGDIYDNAMSYRVCRRGRKWYLQMIAEVSREAAPVTTGSGQGIVGLDFNKGFIELSETDAEGNLVGQKHYELATTGTSGKAETAMRETIAEIVRHCKHQSKDLTIEDLDFIDKKSKAAKGGNNGYNRMLHTLDYGRYRQSVAICCHKNGVGLRLVNPCNTTVIGKNRYASEMGMNGHQAASYVIARRGQGYDDSMKAKRSE